MVQGDLIIIGREAILTALMISAPFFGSKPRDRDYRLRLSGGDADP